MLEVKRSVTVNRSPEEVYRFWREFENLPRFMQHLEAVRTSGGTRTHWVAKGPAGATVEWDAETVEDRPNERLSWRSLAGSDVRNEGVVRFVKAPADRGTEVHVEIRYEAPAGKLGATVAKLFGEEPSVQRGTAGSAAPHLGADLVADLRGILPGGGDAARIGRRRSAPPRCGPSLRFYNHRRPHTSLGRHSP